MLPAELIGSLLYLWENEETLTVFKEMVWTCGKGCKVLVCFDYHYLLEAAIRGSGSQRARPRSSQMLLDWSSDSKFTIVKVSYGDMNAVLVHSYLISKLDVVLLTFLFVELSYSRSHCWNVSRLVGKNYFDYFFPLSFSEEKIMDKYKRLGSILVR